MLETLKETSRYIHQPITIVVDGLDEINTIERNHFVKLLTSLKETSWNWLFTSRFDQDFIDGALKGYSRFIVENHHLVHDIRNFLDGALRGNKTLHTMLRDKALRCDVLETLTCRAQGSFYCAALQIRLPIDQTHPSGIRRALQKHWDTLFSPSVKKELAEVLLAYLSMDAFLSGLYYHIDDFSRRLEGYPLMVYASRYWSRHVREALSLETPEQRIIERVNGFLAKRSNLESSLQVSSITPKPPKVYQEVLPSTRKILLYTQKGLRFIDEFPEMVSDQDSFGTSALHEAAGAGSVDLVNMLLTAGSQPLIQDKDGKSPLYHAAKARHMCIKEILLKYGGSSGSSIERDTHGRYDENISGYHDNLQSFPEAAGQHELSGGRDEPNPSELELDFYDAAAAGNADVVQQVLNDRENIKPEKHGTKALVLAIQREHEEVLEILIRNGANPSCPDGAPAIGISLHRAIRHGNVRTASPLLDSGANLQTRDSHNRTALFEALHSLNTNGAALLLYNAINISATDYLGDTVLHKAVEKGLLGHAQLLIDQGIEVDACNKEGMTPLHLAARYGHYHLFRLLLREGANVNTATFSTRETPLMFAVSADSIELCQMLIRRGADTNAISSDKKTPLMLAADAGNVHLVEDLLSNGADPKLSKYEPRESPGPAAEFRHRLIQRLLEEQNASLQAVNEESAWDSLAETY